MKKFDPSRIFALGERYAVTSTITDSFVPMKACGSQIFGRYVGHDTYDRWFIDFCSGIGVSNLGHAHLSVGRAMLEQFKTGLWGFPGHDWHNRPSVLLMKELCAIAPIQHPRVFLCNSGAESVEAAIKMVLAHHWRHRKAARTVFVACEGAFHGRTLGALSLNCSKVYHTQPFFPDRGVMLANGLIKRRAIEVQHIPFPCVWNAKSKDEFYTALNDLHPREVGAVVIELVQGEGGIRMIDEYALQQLVRWCKRHNVLLVVDEVQTGMMRTGTMFACEHFGLQPDIICLAKALGGGLPIGAIVARKDLDFDRGEHSNTFGGNPLACAAALATICALKKMDKRELKKKIAMLSSFAPEGLGMMRREVFVTAAMRDNVVEEALRRGLLLLGAGTTAIRLMPPVNISMDDLARGCSIYKAARQRVLGQ